MVINIAVLSGPYHKDRSAGTISVLLQTGGCSGWGRVGRGGSRVDWLWGDEAEDV